MGRFVTSETPSLTDQWIELQLRELGQDLDQPLAVEPLATRGHELDERLAGVAALAHDQMAQVALVRLLAVRRQLLLLSPLAHPVADRVAEVGRQPALLDLEHLVPPAGLVQAERRDAVRVGERVLHLVAVVELRDGGDDRLEREVDEAGEPLERVADPAVLRVELRRVVEILEAAAAAGGVVGARRVDAVRPGGEHLGDDRLGVAALRLRHARLHPVAREAAAHEDDEAVEARDAVPAEGEGVDRQLELLASLDGDGHVQQASGDPSAPRSGLEPAVARAPNGARRPRALR